MKENYKNDQCSIFFRIFDFVENKMHLGIKNKCGFILYFTRLLLL